MLQLISPLPDLCSPPDPNLNMVCEFLACDPFLMFFTTVWYLLFALLVDLILKFSLFGSNHAVQDCRGITLAP